MSDADLPPLPVVIAGPTACGKSALAIALAQAIDGELVCADSRQVYARMHIGVAAPSAQERALVPHHNFGVQDPARAYDAAAFIADTDAAVQAIQSRGKRPILVGGTGMYLRAWRLGLSDVPPGDAKVRAQLEAELRAKGAPVLHARLAQVDPESAARIAPADKQRVVRALEILAVTGRPQSALLRSHALDREPRRAFIGLLLTVELSWLRPRVQARAEQMFAGGLVPEALALREYLGPAHALLRTMGYAEALALADGTMSQEEAVTEAGKRQHHYARRQRTWFKKEPWWTPLSAAQPHLYEAALAHVHQSG